MSPLLARSFPALRPALVSAVPGTGQEHPSSPGPPRPEYGFACPERGVPLPRRPSIGCRRARASADAVTPRHARATLRPVVRLRCRGTPARSSRNGCGPLPVERAGEIIAAQLAVASTGIARCPSTAATRAPSSATSAGPPSDEPDTATNCSERAWPRLRDRGGLRGARRREHDRARAELVIRARERPVLRPRSPRGSSGTMSRPTTAASWCGSRARCRGRGVPGRQVDSMPGMTGVPMYDSHLDIEISAEVHRSRTQSSRSTVGLPNLPYLSGSAKTSRRQRNAGGNAHINEGDCRVGEQLRRPAARCRWATSRTRSSGWTRWKARLAFRTA